jgi:hypothetical protein
MNFVGGGRIRTCNVGYCLLTEFSSACATSPINRNYYPISISDGRVSLPRRAANLIVNFSGGQA